MPYTDVMVTNLKCLDSNRVGVGFWGLGLGLRFQGSVQGLGLKLIVTFKSCFAT